MRAAIYVSIAYCSHSYYNFPMDDYKQKLIDLLTETARQNASDLHLAVGRKPTLRIDGVLVPLEKEPVMTPESAERASFGTLDHPGAKRKTDAGSADRPRLQL